MCDKSPSEFWDYTPAEITLMIEEATKKQEQELDLRLNIEARLCSVIMNANGAKKENHRNFEMKDFLPDKTTHNTPKNVEDFELMVRYATIAAGGHVK